MRISEWCKPILTEGGNVFVNPKLRRINLQEIPNTLNWISQQTKLPVDLLKTNVLGSTGKTATSGDIDIGVNKQTFPPEKIISNLEKTLDKTQFKYNPGLDTLHILTPIMGDSKNGYIQTDLMFSTEPNWLKFAFFSPGAKSQYKGVYRTILLLNVANTISDFLKLDDQGMILAKAGPVFVMPKGLIYQYRLRQKRKDGMGYTQQVKSVSREEFLKEYPQANKWIKDFGVETDPNKVAQILFGPNTSQKDLESFESVWNQIQTKFKLSQQQLVKKLYVQALDNAGIAIPKDLQ